jgi:hypothetical protein
MSNSENSFGMNTENEEKRYFHSYPKTYYYFFRVVGFFRKLGINISEFVSKRKEDLKRNYPESYKKASDIKVKTNESFGNLKEWFNEKMETQVSPESATASDLELGNIHRGYPSYESKSLGRFIPQTKTVNLDTEHADSDEESESSIKSIKSNNSDDIVIIVRDSDIVLSGNEEVFHIGDNEGLEKEDSEQEF